MMVHENHGGPWEWSLWNQTSFSLKTVHFQPDSILSRNITFQLQQRNRRRRRNREAAARQRDRRQQIQKTLEDELKNQREINIAQEEEIQRIKKENHKLTEQLIKMRKSFEQSLEK